MNNLIAENNYKAGLISRKEGIAEKAGSLLDEIVPGIKETAELIQNISKSSGEQNESLTQVTNGIEHLNFAAQTTAASSEELTSTADVLKDKAVHLDEIASFFRIKTDHPVIR